MRIEKGKANEYGFEFKLSFYSYEGTDIILYLLFFNKYLYFVFDNVLKPRKDYGGVEIGFSITNRLLGFYYPKVINFMEDYLKNFIGFRLYNLFEYNFIKKEEIDFMNFYMLIPKYPYNGRTLKHNIEAKLIKYYYKNKLGFKTEQYKVDAIFDKPMECEGKGESSWDLGLNGTYEICFSIKDKDKFTKKHISGVIAKNIYEDRNR